MSHNRVLVDLTGGVANGDTDTIEIKYENSENLFVGARFIMECGRKLNIESTTTATACCLFHNFFKVVNVEDYDIYLIACACLYLSGKLEENEQLRIRDLINVSHTTLHPKSEPMALDSEYFNTREAICQAELLVLRMVKFQTKFEHPHKYLLHYLRSLRDWVSEDVWQKYPIAKTSWALLQDFYHDPRVLTTDKSHLSVACISIALQTYGIQIPYAGGGELTAWTKAFCPDLSKEELWDIMVNVMKVYSNDIAIVKPLCTKH